MTAVIFWYVHVERYLSQASGKKGQHVVKPHRASQVLNINMALAPVMPAGAHFGWFIVQFLC